MKMKKFLALSTASVMALSMAACGSTDNGATESSARVAVIGVGVADDPRIFRERRFAYFHDCADDVG